MARALKINICTTITTVLHSCGEFRLVDAPVLHSRILFAERIQHTRLSLSAACRRILTLLALLSPWCRMYVRADLYDPGLLGDSPLSINQLPTQRFTDGRDLPEDNANNPPKFSLPFTAHPLTFVQLGSPSFTFTRHSQASLLVPSTMSNTLVREQPREICQSTIKI